ncbi:MAG: hypothetical protein MUF13_09950 [Akkermansiaceae bacterium]|nr:hypothetical protein [Akkermansiaceae bacterium]
MLPLPSREKAAGTRKIKWHETRFSNLTEIPRIGFSAISRYLTKGGSVFTPKTLFPGSIKTQTLTIRYDSLIS